MKERLRYYSKLRIFIYSYCSHGSEFRHWSSLSRLPVVLHTVSDWSETLFATPPTGGTRASFACLSCSFHANFWFCCCAVRLHASATYVRLEKTEVYFWRHFATVWERDIHCAPSVTVTSSKEMHWEFTFHYWSVTCIAYIACEHLRLQRYAYNCSLTNFGPWGNIAQLRGIIFQRCPRHQSMFVLLYHEINATNLCRHLSQHAECYRCQTQAWSHGNRQILPYFRVWVCAV